MLKEVKEIMSKELKERRRMKNIEMIKKEPNKNSS